MVDDLTSWLVSHTHMPLQGFPENSDGDIATGGSGGVVVDHQRKAKSLWQTKNIGVLCSGVGR